jgi:hypothetical protein
MHGAGALLIHAFGNEELVSSRTVTELLAGTFPIRPFAIDLLRAAREFSEAATSPSLLISMQAHRNREPR